MSAIEGNVIKTETNNDWAQGVNVEMRQINEEQKMIIEKLEEVLHFLKSADIKNEEALVNITKPLVDDLQSSMKYLPSEPSFEIIPSEIKTKILSYLCDSNAFLAASVCLEWKEILKSRFTEKTVTIGRQCCDYKCKDDGYQIPSEMLKASTVHRMDVSLRINQPVTEVDSELLTDALTSVSNFTIYGRCTCEFYDSFDSDSSDCGCETNPLSIDQLEDLFKGLEKRDDIMQGVELDMLDLRELNQDRLVHCFVNKIKNLALCERTHGKMFNIELLIRKLSQEPTEFKLDHLTLDKLEYPDELAIELGNALCNVEYVELKTLFSIHLVTVKQLFKNILTRSVKIKSLIIWIFFQDFESHISPGNLKKLLNKMTQIRLSWPFTSEQVEAARSLPDVTVERFTITKGL